MADFLKTYNELILPNEGGYANKKGDKGGETYAGIARNYHPDWSGWTYIDSVKKVRTVKWNEKFPALNDAVKNFYKARWNKIRLDEINSQAIADLIFDYYTHSETTAIKALQRVLGVGADGVMGSITITATNKANVTKLYKEYLQQRKDYLIERSKQPEQDQFFDGWMNRIAFLNSRAPVAAVGIGVAIIAAIVLWTLSNS